MTLLAEIALLAAAAIGVVVCFRLIPASTATRRRPTGDEQPVRPDQLLASERLVSSGQAMAIYAHATLRPALIEIASQRLAARGQALGRLSDRAGEDLLGDRLWELVRPNRPFPEDRHAPGVSLQDLEAMLDVLERL
jgi:hypothetical protein